MHVTPSPWQRGLVGGLLALLLVGWSAGCVRVEQTLRLNDDGSGSLSLRYGMAESDLAEMESLAKSQLAEEGVTEAAPVNPFEFDEAQVRKDFEDYRSLGVTLEDIRTEVVEGWKYMSLRIAFTSLAGLGQTEFLSDRQVTLKRLAEGRYELVQAAPPGTDEATEAMDPEAMAGLMKGFRAVLRVELPGAVVETNADEKEGARASWIFDVDKDARALERAQRVAMRVVFEKPGLSLVEYASPVIAE